MPASVAISANGANRESTRSGARRQTHAFVVLLIMMALYGVAPSWAILTLPCPARWGCSARWHARRAGQVAACASASGCTSAP